MFKKHGIITSKKYTTKQQVQGVPSHLVKNKIIHIYMNVSSIHPHTHKKKKYYKYYIIPGLPWYLSWQRIHLQCRRPQFNSWVRKIPWRRDRLPTPVFLGFPGGSDVGCNVGVLGSILGLGRSPGGGHGNTLQYCLEDSMDRIAWWAVVHGVINSQTRLSN